MSTSTEGAVMTPSESVDFYLPLVKEYSEKLSAMCSRACDVKYELSQSGHAVALQNEAARLIDLHERLRPIVEQLLRRTASILDLAKLDRDQELALALRQEELEAHFRFAPIVFDELEKRFGSKVVRSIIERTRIKVQK